jgi:trans-2,3-dihydro-3-hydroxyanthranilate isomerase
MNRRDFGRTSMMGLAGAALPRTPLGPEQRAGGGASYRYVHVDVFTDRRLEGNPLLVFPQPTGLDADRMQALTRESNYSECTFVFPPEAAGSNYRIRIFGRAAEMPFAGHPTLGTAFALAHAGVLKPGTARTVFGLGVGPTNVDLDWKDGRLAFAWMTQLKPTFGKTIADTAALAAAIGVEPAAIGGPHAPQEVNCGSNFLIVPLSSRKAVDAAVLDRAKVDAVFTAAGIQRRGIYVFSNEEGTDKATAYTRLLGAGGTEDPGTGSAAGPAACFMMQHRFVPAQRAGSIELLQGVLVKRPCRIHAKVELTGAEVTGIKVGGGAVVVGEGTMGV